MIELIEKFLERLEKLEGRSYHTIRAYRSTLEENELSIDDVDEDVIEEFLLYLARRGLKPRSLKRHLDALRKFFKYIKKNIDWDSLKIPVKESLDFKVLSEEDVDKIIKHAYDKNYVYGLMLQLGYEAGLRASELADLNVEDVDLVECLVYVKPKKREETRIPIPISIDLCEKIKRYLEYRPLFPGDPLFTTKHGNRWRPYLISHKVFREVADELGYYDVRYHSFARHSRATNLLKQGLDIYTVSRLLRHRSLNTTTKYIHLLPEDLRKKLMEVDKKRLYAKNT